MITYTNIQSYVKETIAAAPTNGRPSQSDVTAYIADADALITSRTGASAQSSQRDNLVISGAVAYWREAINALAQQAGSKVQYQDPWKEFNDQAKEFKESPGNPDLIIGSIPDTSSYRWA